jgi:hypothetical protein
MINYVLNTPKNKKQVNCERAPYKCIKSNEESMHEVIIQINKKYQEEIYSKLFQVQKELKKEKIYSSRKKRKLLRN